MTSRSQSRGPLDWLIDRHAERGRLDRLIHAVRDGTSQVLVIHGEAGVGKTSLLEYLRNKAEPDCQVSRIAGVQSEMELPFAGLHQLCGPMLDRLGRLPAPQADALRTAFGLSGEAGPDRFMVSLAVLGLLSEVAEARPLVCVIDDMQWIDRASAQVLGFVARRLKAEPIALVFATRSPDDELARLPELKVTGLREKDAQALLDSVVTRGMDVRVREQVIAETQGNPLALLELLREHSEPELAGGFGLAAAAPLAGRIQESFRRQIDLLPEQARRLVQLAAGDPTGDPLLVRRAASRLEIPVHASVPAAEAGLLEFGVRVRFRHPLVRSAAYWSASSAARRELHQALAEATDPEADPDRRAWHRAQAAPGADEDVAAELERSAGRAQARGGLAAAAAFLERASLLTADPARWADRTLAAARANFESGLFDKAAELLTSAESGELDEFAGARADLLRGQVAFASGMGADAPPLLLNAARRLASLDAGLARETCLEAWIAAMYAGHLAADGDLREVSRTAISMVTPAPGARPADVLLHGLAVLVADGPAAAAPALRRARNAFADARIPVADMIRWGWMIPAVDYALWDDESWAQTERQVQVARAAGALSRMPILLQVTAFNAMWSGEFATAAAVIAQADSAIEATGTRVAPYPAMTLAALRGRATEAAALIGTVVEDTTPEGQGIAVTWAHWATAIMNNGLGRYDEARAAARQAALHDHVYISWWALPELIEAATRTASTRLAADALEQLAERTRAGASDYGLGIEARCRALLARGQAAEESYREAIDRLGRTRRRPELARAYLLYGEWLRRERRLSAAREQLRVATEMLNEIGMEAFATRASRELLAAGGTAARRAARAPRGDAAQSATGSPGGGGETLTSQEALVACLARDGLSNPEIGARLFISPRTVQYHLSKVFAKLGITSRSQLHRALPGDLIGVWAD
ncbi:MAG TPA: AAA family ATPase [Trebonia sp.]|jgi:ATP/maltotriose-dependent transcriptional regulator MalT|nr:AAA family ATPase [Trebonia sp.]